MEGGAALASMPPSGLAHADDGGGRRDNAGETLRALQLRSHRLLFAVQRQRINTALRELAVVQRSARLTHGLALPPLIILKEGAPIGSLGTWLQGTAERISHLG